MNEMLKDVLEAGQFDFKPFKENVAINFIALTRKNQEKVKPGMYWYEDDTVSEQFTSAKKLKSLVLFVDADVVYGDSFEQRYVLGRKIDAYLKELMNSKFVTSHKELLHRPKVGDLQAVFAHFEQINQALKKIKKLGWSEDLFWAQKVDNQFVSTVDMIDGEDNRMSLDSGAYFRPMVAYSL